MRENWKKFTSWLTRPLFKFLFIAAVAAILIYSNWDELPEQIPTSTEQTVTVNEPFDLPIVVPSPDTGEDGDPPVAFRQTTVTKTTEDLQLFFLSVPTLKAIAIIGYVLLAIIAYYMVTLPFRNIRITEITASFFGLSYKLVMEKRTEIAEETVTSFIADEQARLGFLENLSKNNQIQESIALCVENDGTIDETAAAQFLASHVEYSFDQFEKLDAAPAAGGKLQELELNGAEEALIQLARSAASTRQHVLGSDSRSFALPLHLNDDFNQFTVLYGNSAKMLTAGDMLMLKTGWNIVTFLLTMAAQERQTNGHAAAGITSHPPLLSEKLTFEAFSKSISALATQAPETNPRFIEFKRKMEAVHPKNIK